MSSAVTADNSFQTAPFDFHFDTPVLASTDNGVMAGWFSRVLQGGTPAEAEPVMFSLTCRCGNIVTGTRELRMHVAVCRECRSQICVLPASPYPRPKTRTPKAPQKQDVSKPARSRKRLEKDSLETPAPLTQRTSRRERESPKPAVQKSSRAKSKPLASDSRTPQISVARRQQVVTPLRLIALGMIGVVMLAGWWVVHRRAVGQAVVTFAEAAKLGRTALAELDYDSADQQLVRAVTALDLLQRDDREARQVRQLSREASAARGLAPSSLFELVSEARNARQSSSTNWQQSIKHAYQGRWFLLETNGLQFPPSEPPQWRFSLTLVPGSEPVQISGDLARWSGQLGSQPPQRVILAGQLEEIRPLGGPAGTGFEIVLRKESLCLWTNPDLYSALGGTLDDGSRATLNSQAHLLELKE